MPVVAAVYPDAVAAQAAIASLGPYAPGSLEVTPLSPDSSATSLTNNDAHAAPASLFRDRKTDGMASAPTLFVSAPVVGPLIVLGYGAEIAGVAGAVRGLRLHEDVLAALVTDALAAGYYAVVVHAAGDLAQRRARDAINETMAEDTGYA